MTDNAHLFGWCSPHDQQHRLCRVTYTTPFGVVMRCSCPRHEDDETPEDAA